MKNKEWAIAAINDAARKADMSYGRFVFVTPPEELERIVNEYRHEPKEKQKKS